MSTSEKIVICCLGDEAFSRVSSAAPGLGFQFVRSSRDEVRKTPNRPNVVAMIYDLEAPSPEIAADIIQHWRSVYPTRAILLYYRPSAYVAQLVGAVGHLPGVVTWAQTDSSPNERHDLARLLRALLSRTPELLGRALVNAIHTSASATVKVFLEALIDRLERDGAGAPAVSQVASRAGLKTWAVRRACRAARFPTPERLIEWLTLIYVIACAEWQRISIARAAGSVGVSDKYVRKLRASLLPEIQRLTGSAARDALAQAILRFSEECRLPPERAAALAKQLVV